MSRSPAEDYPPSASERLRRKIELILPELAEAGRRLLDHPRIADLYAPYLITSHWIVRASVPLMQAALQRCRQVERTDPVASALGDYLEEHIPEELHHDEWLLKDLEVLGISRSAVLAGTPSPTVAALVGAQYYWILHHHPAALLGYIELLEGYPPLRDEIETLIERTGHDRAAFRTLLHHAELDPHHSGDLHRLLDGLPLTAEHSKVLGLSAMHSVHLMAAAIGEIMDESSLSG